MAESYYLWEDERVTGPHSLRVLQQKAEIRALDATSLLRHVHPQDAAWAPLSEFPELAALVLPTGERPRLQLGGRGPEAVAQAEAQRASISVEELLRQNRAQERLGEAPLVFPPGPDPYERRRRRFWVQALVLLLPAILLWAFGPLPRSSATASVLLGIVGAVLALLWWFNYVLKSPGE